MGEEVYDRSGVSELSAEQLKVLESWILNNAVESHVITQPEVKPSIESVPAIAEPAVAAPAAAPVAAEAEPQPAKAEAPATDTDQPAQPASNEPRNVRLAEEPPEAAAEADQPATQKYVLIESLEERDRNVEPDLIRSRIDGTFKGWKNNKTRFRLENGEVWEQSQSSTYITNLESPEVIIRKHRFGYTMEVPAIDRRVHVRRIR